MLGSRIASLRKSAGMSQAKLAQQLNISASTLGSYEQGRREPSCEILVILAQIFDVSVDYLLTGNIYLHKGNNLRSRVLNWMLSYSSEDLLALPSKEILSTLLLICLSDE